MQALPLPSRLVQTRRFPCSLAMHRTVVHASRQILASVLQGPKALVQSVRPGTRHTVTPKLSTSAPHLNFASPGSGGSTLNSTQRE